MTFTGSLQELQAVVTLLHLEGHLSNAGDQQVFRAVSGDHIHVWPASGELQVQGHPQSSSALAERLEQGIASQGH
ncbi:MAG: hypothetical protein VKM34_03040 [Cyanobacteriota bacterium]|nr:hypothetical protein [Cyanobacteriota bacterium]